MQTAVSVNIICGTAVNICISWSGDYWREREGGRQICLGPAVRCGAAATADANEGDSEATEDEPLRNQQWALVPVGATGIIGWLAPFSFVLFSSWSPAGYPHGILYTVVIFWTVYGNLFGGMAQGGGGALGVDVLPIGPDGRPSNPARDSNLQGYAGLLPNAILPLFLGGAMKWFPSHLAAL